MVDQHRPWGNDPVLGGRQGWQRSKEAYEDWMMDNGLGKQNIDEVALFFSSREAKWDFIEDAVKQQGVELTSVASDEVHTRPLDTTYQVEYAFLTIPDQAMRLELMDIPSGYSPLHSAMAMRKNDHPRWPVGVHVSFKVPPSQYADLCDVMLAHKGMDLAQECDSTYGLFSYWKVLDLWNKGSIYLKPRCNMRDMQQADFGFPGIGGRAVHDIPLPMPQSDDPSLGDL